MSRAVRVFVLALAVAGLLSAPAAAMSTDQAVYDILREFRSPLAEESYTVVAFWRAHPEFSIVDFYAVLWAESSLGRGATRHHNIASIKGGSRGTLWRDLRIGTTPRGYNIYRTFRDGQRAALRLVLERYGGSVLSGGLHRYYGYGVPGWQAYRNTIYAARAQLRTAAQRRGIIW